MPEKSSTATMGHPNTVIDWKMVDDMLAGGCPGTEIASYLGVCEDTLYRHCQKEKEMTFAAYKHSKASKGEAALRMKAYTLAMSGNTKVLLHLCKHRLRQWDKQIEENTTTFLADIDNSSKDLVANKDASLPTE
jgi:hypothetical protein